MEQQTTVKPLPYFYVGQQITTDRIQRFEGQKHRLLSEAIGKPDTKSVWYSKEHFVKLLEEIEYANGNGICVHFGTYEEGHQYAGQTCLLFITTRINPNGRSSGHINVVLEEEEDFPLRSSLPREVILFPGDNGIGDDRDFNLGSPCPPRCDGDPFGKIK